MAHLEVTAISGIASGTSYLPVHFETGVAGDGNHMSFTPELLDSNPPAFATNVDVTSNISFTFNQNIELVPNGIIELRSGSNNGTLIESFNTGNSSALSVNNDTLTINPSNDLNFFTDIFVVLPSVGIANTFGASYSGVSNYSFKTQYQQLNATGGTHTFPRAHPSSPTNYYKYHVFLGTGNLQMNVPSKSNPDFRVLVVGGGGSGGNGYSPSYAAGGGGGAGGVLEGPASSFVDIPSGTHTITVGGGGARVPHSGSNYDPQYSGNPSKIGNIIGLEAYGGGHGGVYDPGASKDAANGGSGGGGWGGPTPQQKSVGWIPPNNNGPSKGFQTRKGGYSYPTQGNPGGISAKGYNPNYGDYYGAGGGGGAGGQGDNSTYPSWNGPTQWPSYPNHPNWRCMSGDGGPGKPSPHFSNPIIGPYCPLIPGPSKSEIGNNGMYGGGGGGGAGDLPWVTAGNGGQGGGGHGGFVNWPPSSYPYAPSPFSPNVSPPYNAEDGYVHLGGGGGGGCSPNPSNYNIGAGGSGIVIVRYAIPSTLS